MHEKATYSPQNYIQVAFLNIEKNIVPIKSYATLKSSKYATLPQDYQSLSRPTTYFQLTDIASCNKLEIFKYGQKNRQKVTKPLTGYKCGVFSRLSRTTSSDICTCIFVGYHGCISK